jgi:hypothetical protein
MLFKLTGRGQRGHVTLVRTEMSASTILGIPRASKELEVGMYASLPMERML